MSAKITTVAKLSMSGPGAPRLPSPIRVTYERSGTTKQEYLVDASALSGVLEQFDEPPGVLEHLGNITQILERLAGSCALVSLAIVCASAK